MKTSRTVEAEQAAVVQQESAVDSVSFSFSSVQSNFREVEPSPLAIKKLKKKDSQTISHWGSGGSVDARRWGFSLDFSEPDLDYLYRILHVAQDERFCTRISTERFRDVDAYITKGARGDDPKRCKIALTIYSYITQHGHLLPSDKSLENIVNVLRDPKSNIICFEYAAMIIGHIVHNQDESPALITAELITSVVKKIIKHYLDLNSSKNKNRVYFKEESAYAVLILYSAYAKMNTSENNLSLEELLLPFSAYARLSDHEFNASLEDYAFNGFPKIEEVTVDSLFNRLKKYTTLRDKNLQIKEIRKLAALNFTKDDGKESVIKDSIVPILEEEIQSPERKIKLNAIVILRSLKKLNANYVSDELLAKVETPFFYHLLRVATLFEKNKYFPIINMCSDFGCCLDRTIEHCPDSHPKAYASYIKSLINSEESALADVAVKSHLLLSPNVAYQVTIEIDQIIEFTAIELSKGSSDLFLENIVSCISSRLIDPSIKINTLVILQKLLKKNVLSKESFSIENSSEIKTLISTEHENIELVNVALICLSLLPVEVIPEISSQWLKPFLKNTGCDISAGRVFNKKLQHDDLSGDSSKSLLVLLSELKKMKIRDEAIEVIVIGVLREESASKKLDQISRLITEISSYKIKLLCLVETGKIVEKLPIFHNGRCVAKLPNNLATMLVEGLTCDELSDKDIAQTDEQLDRLEEQILVCKNILCKYVSNAMLSQDLAIKIVDLLTQKATYSFASYEVFRSISASGFAPLLKRHLKIFSKGLSHDCEDISEISAAILCNCSVVNILNQDDLKSMLAVLPVANNRIVNYILRAFINHINLLKGAVIFGANQDALSSSLANFALDASGQPLENRQHALDILKYFGPYKKRLDFCVLNKLEVLLKGNSCSLSLKVAEIFKSQIILLKNSCENQNTSFIAMMKAVESSLSVEDIIPLLLKVLSDAQGLGYSVSSEVTINQLALFVQNHGNVFVRKVAHDILKNINDLPIEIKDVVELEKAAIVVVNSVAGNRSPRDISQSLDQILVAATNKAWLTPKCFKAIELALKSRALESSAQPDDFQFTAINLCEAVLNNSQSLPPSLIYCLQKLEKSWRSDREESWYYYFPRLSQLFSDYGIINSPANHYAYQDLKGLLNKTEVIDEDESLSTDWSEKDILSDKDMSSDDLSAEQEQPKKVARDKVSIEAFKKEFNALFVDDSKNTVTMAFYYIELMINAKGWKVSSISGFLKRLKEALIILDESNAESLLCVFENAYLYSVSQVDFFAHEQACLSEFTLENLLSIIEKKQKFSYQSKGNSVRGRSYFLANINKLEKIIPNLGKYLEVIMASAQPYSQVANPVMNWQESDIQDWLTLTAQRHDKVPLDKVISVVRRACQLKGYFEPRYVQMVAVLALAGGSIDKGAFAQIATGEGKSFVIVLLVIFLKLTKRNSSFDIITTNKNLAMRDAKAYASLYQLFGISVAGNDDADYISGAKSCYEADVVYSGIYDFQHDILRHEVHFLSTRTLAQADRAYDAVIVDEVDNLLLDESSTLAMLSSPVAGMNYLMPILGALLAKSLSLFNESKNINSEEIKAQLLGYANKLVNNGLDDADLDVDDVVYVPCHLKDLAIAQIDAWVTNVMAAHLSCHVNRNYSIELNKNGREIIVPVDYVNTGTLQFGSSLMNGMQLALQFKHGLEITPENLVTTFISNFGLTQKYKSANMYGITGTLGSRKSRCILEKTYKIRCLDIPTFKEKNFRELSGLLLDKALWEDAVMRRSSSEAKKGRIVLITCEDMASAKYFLESLKKQGQRAIYDYTKGTPEEERIFYRALLPGTIIVSTTIAGRGTDIKLPASVIDSGGLFVCCTFMPSSQSNEDQIFGRSARCGQPGSGQLILNLQNTCKILNIEASSSLTMSQCKTTRDEIEANNLDRKMQLDFKVTQLKQELFDKFLKFKLQMTEDDKHLIDDLRLYRETISFARDPIQLGIYKQYCENLGIKLSLAYDLAIIITPLKQKAIFELWGIWLAKQKFESAQDVEQGPRIYQTFETALKKKYQSADVDSVIDNSMCLIEIANCLSIKSKRMMNYFKQDAYCKLALHFYDKALQKDAQFVYVALYNKVPMLVKLATAGYQADVVDSLKKLLVMINTKLDTRSNSLLAISEVIESHSQGSYKDQLMDQMLTSSQTLKHLLDSVESALCNVVGPSSNIDVHHSDQWVKGCNAKKVLEVIERIKEEDIAFKVVLRSLKGYEDLVTCHQLCDLPYRDVTIIYDSQLLMSSDVHGEALLKLLPLQQKESDVKPNENVAQEVEPEERGPLQDDGKKSDVSKKEGKSAKHPAKSKSTNYFEKASDVAQACYDGVNYAAKKTLEFSQDVSDMAEDGVYHATGIESSVRQASRYLVSIDMEVVTVNQAYGLLDSVEKIFKQSNQSFVQGGKSGKVMESDEVILSAIISIQETNKIISEKKILKKTSSQLRIILEESIKLPILKVSILIEDVKQSIARFIVVLPMTAAKLYFKNLTYDKAKSLVSLSPNNQVKACYTFEFPNKKSAIRLIKKAQQLEENLIVKKKSLKDVFDKKNKSSYFFDKLKQDGYLNFYELTENKTFPVRSICFLAGMAVSEIGAGFALLFISPAHAPKAFSEGAMDCVRIISTSWYREFSLKQYSVQKAVSIGIMGYQLYNAPPVLDPSYGAPAAVELVKQSAENSADNIAMTVAASRNQLVEMAQQVFSSVSQKMTKSAAEQVVVMTAEKVVSNTLIKTLTNATFDGVSQAVTSLAEQWLRKGSLKLCVNKIRVSMRNIIKVFVDNEFNSSLWVERFNKVYAIDLFANKSTRFHQNLLRFSAFESAHTMSQSVISVAEFDQSDFKRFFKSFSSHFDVDKSDSLICKVNNFEAIFFQALARESVELNDVDKKQLIESLKNLRVLRDNYTINSDTLFNSPGDNLGSDVANKNKDIIFKLCARYDRVMNDDFSDSRRILLAYIIKQLEEVSIRRFQSGMQVIFSLLGWAGKVAHTGHHNGVHITHNPNYHSHFPAPHVSGMHTNHFFDFHDSNHNVFGEPRVSGFEATLYGSIEASCVAFNENYKAKVQKNIAQREVDAQRLINDSLQHEYDQVIKLLAGHKRMVVSQLLLIIQGQSYEYLKKIENQPETFVLLRNVGRILSEENRKQVISQSTIFFSHENNSYYFHYKNYDQSVGVIELTQPEDISVMDEMVLSLSGKQLISGAQLISAQTLYSKVMIFVRSQYLENLMDHIVAKIFDGFSTSHRVAILKKEFSNLQLEITEEDVSTLEEAFEQYNELYKQKVNIMLENRELINFDIGTFDINNGVNGVLGLVSNVGTSQLERLLKADKITPAEYLIGSVFEGIFKGQADMLASIDRQESHINERMKDIADHEKSFMATIEKDSATNRMILSDLKNSFNMDSQEVRASNKLLETSLFSKFDLVISGEMSIERFEKFEKICFRMMDENRKTHESSKVGLESLTSALNANAIDPKEISTTIKYYQETMQKFVGLQRACLDAKLEAHKASLTGLVQSAGGMLASGTKKTFGAIFGSDKAKELSAPNEAGLIEASPKVTELKGDDEADKKDSSVSHLAENSNALFGAASASAAPGVAVGSAAKPVVH